MKRFFLSLIACLGAYVSASSQNADTWVATDALGRTMPTADEAPLKTDRQRTVGIFYITWHTPNLHNGQPYKADVSKVLRQDPNARMNNESPAWTIGSYHWGEPEYGYFLSQDRYVIRHDLMMLADAGVDVLILDVTNAVATELESIAVDFTGATSIAGGASGFVPAPAAGDQNKFLRGDGTWVAEETFTPSEIHALFS